MKEGGTGLHKTIREINLVYKGLILAIEGQDEAINEPCSSEKGRLGC